MFGFGQKRKDVPALRLRQIHDLQAIPGMKQLKTDGSEFLLPFFLADGRTAAHLHIALSPEFPTRPPVLTASNTITHPWLNAAGQVIGHTMLQRWAPEVSLSRVVQEICSKLSREGQAAVAPNQPLYPPVSQPPSGYPGQAYPVPGPNPVPVLPLHPHPPNIPPQVQPTQPPTQPQSGAEGRPPPPPPRQAPAPPPRAFPKPVIPANFPQLEKLSMSELNELSSNPEKYHDFFESLDPVKSVIQLNESLTSETHNLAKSNLEARDKLTVLQQELAELRERVNADHAKFVQVLGRQRQVAQRFDKQNLGTLLDHKAQIAYDESRELAQSFIRRGIDIQTFVRDFQPLRASYHLRMATRERLLFAGST